ncbi:MAG: FkbM family methyltransferase [Lachnospiraceae bacterium]|nr:FkbM family methyltransferase [Lachnospiraceae bacterium]
MSVSTNPLLNRIVIQLGKIGNGKIQNCLIRMLYFYYRNFPPANVVEAKKYYAQHADEIEQVVHLLADEKSKGIYRKMIAFRGSYDMRIHPESSTDDMYFVDGIIRLTNEECFVDCGAFIGDSIARFLECVGTGNYRAIVAFEPDQANYQQLVQRNYDKIYPHNAGVWSENTTLKFQESGNASSRISDTGRSDLVEVKVENLDSVPECMAATYIKMDIEGSEIQALEGAKEIIGRNKPKLAISIYHKDEDMIKIPLMLHRMNPAYKMYVRQHSHSYFDTVLYCIPADE